MPRNLTDAQRALLQSNTILSEYLIDLEVTNRNRVVSLTTFSRRLISDGREYIPAATLSIKLDDESLELVNSVSTVTLSGLDPDFFGLVQNEQLIGSRLSISQVFFNNETEQALPEPVVLNSGQVSEVRLLEDPDSSTFSIELDISGFFSRFNDVNGVRSNPTEWRNRHPDDGIFDQMPELQDTGANVLF